MMQRRSISPRVSSLKLAILFFVLVSLVITVAITLRIIHTAQHNAFDGEHQFVLLMQQKNIFQLDIFTPTTHSVVVIPIHASSSEPIAQDLAIGVDGKVALTTTNLDTQRNLLQGIFHAAPGTDITWIDLARLYLIAKSVTVRQTIDLSHNKSQIDLHKEDFIDSDLEKENQSIQIINASNASGLGTRLNSVVSKIGGNVIDIRTATQSTKDSAVRYYGTISYTAKRLAHILGFPLKKQEMQSITDIQIVIGTDNAYTHRF